MATSKNITTLLSGQINVQNFHYTVNEITEQLSALCSAVEDHSVNTPPSGINGYTYIVGSSPTGDWDGQADKVAHYYNSSWHFYTPYRGMILYSMTGAIWRVYDGSSWGDA